MSQVQAYRAEAATLDVAACRAAVERGGVDAVTFTSPSAVDELERALGADCFHRLLGQASAIALGATTARAIAARGHHAALAEPTTLEGIARTTQRLLEKR